MAFFLDIQPVGFSHHSTCPNQQITKTCARTNTTMSVMRGIMCCHNVRFFNFAINKHFVVWDKYIVKMRNTHCLSKFSAHFGCRIFRTARRARDNSNTFRINRHGTSDSEILVIFLHSTAGHDEKLMHVRGAGNNGFYAGNYNTVFAALGDMHIGVTNFLLGWAF